MFAAPGVYWFVWSCKAAGLVRSDIFQIQIDCGGKKKSIVCMSASPLVGALTGFLPQRKPVLGCG